MQAHVAERLTRPAHTPEQDRVIALVNHILGLAGNIATEARMKDAETIHPRIGTLAQRFESTERAAGEIQKIVRQLYP
ncbi:MAG: hypothetical protein ABI162_06870 [Luteolibacter sp.]